MIVSKKLIQFPVNAKVTDEAKDLMSNLITDQSSRYKVIDQFKSHPWFTGQSTLSLFFSLSLLLSLLFSVLSFSLINYLPPPQLKQSGNNDNFRLIVDCNHDLSVKKIMSIIPTVTYFLLFLLLRLIKSLINRIAN